MGVVHLDCWNVVELWAPITMNIRHLAYKCISSQQIWSQYANGIVNRDLVFVNQSLSIFLPSKEKIFKGFLHKCQTLVFNCDR